MAHPAAASPQTFDDVRAAHCPSDLRLLDRHGEPLHEQRIDPTRRRLAWTPLDAVSPALTRAVVASEDRRFFVHGGVDWRAVGAALWQRLRGGAPRGASTLTMQVAALLDADLQRGGAPRTLAAKWRQMRAAWDLERHWSKAQILEAYLNLVSFRGELQGIGAAASMLFAKAPHGLTEAESLVLAALIRSPNADRSALTHRTSVLARALRQAQGERMEKATSRQIGGTWQVQEDEDPGDAIQADENPGNAIQVDENPGNAIQVVPHAGIESAPLIPESLSPLRRKDRMGGSADGKRRGSTDPPSFPSPARGEGTLAVGAPAVEKGSARSKPCTGLMDQVSPQPQSANPPVRAELAEARHLATAIDRVIDLPNAAGPRIALAPHAARRLFGTAGAAACSDTPSTLDSALQRVAAEALHRHLLALQGRNVRDGAVLVADNATGAVLAYVGASGALSSARHVDGIQARRQAGSTLKPFLYGLALDRRLLTAASLLDDAPLEVAVGSGLFRPRNYDNQFRGLASVRTALAGSLNVPAVRALLLVGADDFAQQLRALGFKGVDKAGDFYGPSLALGSADVTLWQLVDAYRALANGGVWSPLHMAAEARLTTVASADGAHPGTEACATGENVAASSTARASVPAWRAQRARALPQEASRAARPNTPATSRVPSPLAGEGQDGGKFAMKRTLGLDRPPILSCPRKRGRNLGISDPESTSRQTCRDDRSSEAKQRASQPGTATASAPARRVFSPAAAFVISDILADRDSRAGTFGLESPLATRFWSAVKTGTSKDMRDNWCIGYSRRYTVGVWVGNFSGAPMRDVSGISGAAPIWQDVMEWLQRDEASPPPAPPQGLRAVRATFTDAAEAPRREWFLAATAPDAAPAARARRPRIVAPSDGSLIALDPDIPFVRQRVAFTAEDAHGARWLLDGVDVGSAAQPLLWPPTPGRHTLRLVDGARPVAQVAFQVRG